MMERVSRRGLLGKGAVGAAAVTAAMALPAVAQAVESTGITGHTGLCFHRTYRLRVESTAHDALEERFQASLTPEQRRMWFDLDVLNSNTWCDEQVVFVEELARHLPGVGPAIRALAYDHIFEQALDAQGVCCAGEDA